MEKRKSNYEKVREFHEAFGLSHRDSFDASNPYSGDFPLRLRLIHEEYHEVMEAMERGDPDQIAKELTDLLYVVYGTGVTMGVDLDRAFELIHESNMSKLDDDGKPIYNSYGKVQKSANYRPPDLGELFKNGHKEDTTGT